MKTATEVALELFKAQFRFGHSSFETLSKFSAVLNNEPEILSAIKEWLKQEHDYKEYNIAERAPIEIKIFNTSETDHTVKMCFSPQLGGPFGCDLPEYIKTSYTPVSGAPACLEEIMTTSYKVYEIRRTKIFSENLQQRNSWITCWFNPGVGLYSQHNLWMLTPPQQIDEQPREYSACEDSFVIGGWNYLKVNVLPKTEIVIKMYISAECLRFGRTKIISPKHQKIEEQDAIEIKQQLQKLVDQQITRNKEYSNFINQPA